MAKRLTEKQKDEIVKLFISGIKIEQLSNQFNCTKLTISRNIKKNLGESKYNELAKKNILNNKLEDNKNQKIDYLNKNKLDINIQANDKKIHEISKKKAKEEFFESSQFFEVTPLNYDIENIPQKDFSSIPISDIDFPKTMFMIVDKKVELEIKYLKDYPRWQFLSKEDLKRKTIEIFYDLKIAKSFCSKEKKVIKVPNTSIFKTVAPILISRGISRIVTSDKLISL